MINSGGNGQDQFEMANSLDSMRVSAHEAANIVSRTIGDLVKVQFELGAVASPLSPEGPARLLLQAPALYQSQLQRMARVMTDSFSILIRAQQQLLELEGQSLSWGTRNATHALSKYIGTLARGRTSVQDIDFADRRATARAVDDAVASINADAAKRKASRGQGQITS